MNTNLPPQEYVELELINQRLTEITQSMQLAEQQLEQASVAISVIKELKDSKTDQELLVPVGNGVFFSVQRPAIGDIKVAVGAGVVVDKSAEDALKFVSEQLTEMEAYYQKLVEAYDETVLTAQQLQAKIEKSM
jgi:prefoldin alpha subunit